MTGRQRGVAAAALVATALAGVLRYGTDPGVLSFAVAALALAGLAWLVSFGTEELGAHYSPAVTGILQSTLGNLPEFFIVIFALSAGETVVAQTSIIGSLFANALLILGLVIVVGARSSDDGVMRFGTRLPADTATLLLASTFIIVITGLSVASSDRASNDIKTISAIASGFILLVYATWVWGYLRSDAARSREGSGHKATLSLRAAIAVLAIAGVGAAFASDWFIHALDPAIESLGVSKAFAGLVIVAIAGNAVEHFAGVVLARKRKYELAISVVKNSVAQIAAFLFPALVLVSLAFTNTLTFQLAPIYIGALFLTAIAVWQITGDGEAQEFEGWALIAMYAMLATFTLFE